MSEPWLSIAQLLPGVAAVLVIAYLLAMLRDEIRGAECIEAWGGDAEVQRRRERLEEATGRDVRSRLLKLRATHDTEAGAR